MDLVSASVSSASTLLESIIGKFTKTCESSILKEVSRIQQEFKLKHLNLEETCLYDLIHQFQSATSTASKLSSRLELLHSKIKSNKKLLWNTVTKTVSADGKCLDGNKLKISRKYTIKVLNDKIFNETLNMLAEIEESLIAELTFQFFLKHQMMLKIDQFFYDLINDVGLLDTSSVMGSNLYPSLSPNCDLISIRESVSVLFSFQRKPTKDKKFSQITRSWLNKLVSVLLYNGTLEDNLFIVNHVLRCPNGISAWACQYIQLPSPNSAYRYECRYLHYILKVLYLILNPVSDRNEFLRFINPVEKFSEKPENNVLDSSHTEEDLVNFTRDWSEGDILSLLHQIPFSQLFEHVLSITPTASCPVYNINRVSEDDMQKYLRFSTALVCILFSSLKNYEEKDFLKLTDVICKLAVHTVCYASDHWLNFVNVNTSFSYALQEEFDIFIFHTVHMMFCSCKSSVWKFLTRIPYLHVSYKMLWTLLWIFYSPNTHAKSVLAEKEVEKKLLDESTQFIFLENLNAGDQQGPMYIFSSFQLMALRSNEMNFIHFVTQQIFEASFAHKKLQKFLNLKGITLILSIANEHIFVISILLKQIDQKGSEVAESSEFLLNELNFMMWVPQQEDMKILTKWLINEPFSSFKNHLSWIVLKKMNWNYDRKGNLYLPLRLHKEVAMLVLKACIKFEKEDTNWLVFKTLWQSSRDNNLKNAMWQVIFSLKLHILDQKIPPLVEIYDGFVPTCCTIDMYQDPFLRPLADAFDMNHPQGLYLALIMSKIGHCIKFLQDVGLSCISMLIKSQQYTAATKSLFYVLPFYVKNTEVILSHDEFISSLCNLIIADQSWFSVSTVTGTDSVIYNLASIIKYQMEKASEISIECAYPILKLWLKLLLHLLGDHMHKSKALTMSVYFLLDVLIQIAFTNEDTRDYFIDQINFTLNPYDKSFPSTWWNLFSSEEFSGTLLSKLALPQYPWVSFYLLLIETRQFYKDIWNSMLKEMTKNELLTPSTALKGVSASLNKKCPPLRLLPIYRWAFQIIETSVAHPSFFLLCQQFFLCYFQRVSTRCCNTPEYQTRSIGGVFFAERPFALILEKLKEKLKEAGTHYAMRYSQAVAEVSSCGLSKAKQRDKINFLSACILTLKDFYLWIDEEKYLNKPNVNFSSLTSLHDIKKLKLIFENDQRLWFDHMLVQDVKDEIMKLFPCLDPLTVNSDNIENSKSHVKLERIMKQLHSYKSIKQLHSEPLDPPVKNIKNEIFYSYNSFTKLVREKQEVILKNKDSFIFFLNKIKKLNTDYRTLLPQEYSFKDVEVKEKKYCYKGKNKYNEVVCLGPALIKLLFKSCSSNNPIQNRCLQNRNDYDNMVSQINNVPIEKEVIIASIFMEKCVRDLVKLITADTSNSQKLVQLGVELFYFQVLFIDENNKSSDNYVPLQQFWASSLDLLGRRFIEHNVNECLNLTKILIKYPSVGSFISPFFEPHIAPPHIFIQIYETIALNIRKCSPSTLFVLLSKINLQKWLNDEKVSVSWSTMLFEKLSQALYQCKSTDESLLLVHQILRKHFCLLVLHNFPQHYSDTVQFLLKGVENDSLCVSIWYDVLYCLGFTSLNEECSYEDVRNILRSIGKDKSEFAEHIFLPVLSLTIKEVLESLKVFHKFISNVCSSNSPYVICKNYIKPMGMFLAMLGHLLVEWFMKRNTVSYTVEAICDIFQSTFHPYIYPIEKEPYLKLPWSLTDENDALFIFQMFAMCLEYFHERLSSINYDRSTLSYIWEYYYNTYGKYSYINNCPDVCHTALKNISWNDFHPSFDHIQGMYFVLLSMNNKNKTFVSNVITTIPWLDVITGLDQSVSPDYIRKTFLALAELFIICGWEDAVENVFHRNNCKAVENVSWHYLTVGDAEKLLTLYYHHSVPVNMLKNEPDTIPEIYVLRFLKFLCCMLPQNTNDSNSNKKRLIFIKKYIDALHLCIAEKKELFLSNSKNIFNVVPSLFNDIELVILKDTPPAQQFSYSIPLLQEALRFPNFINDVNNKNEILKLSVTWLKGHMESPLILPCINAACTVLTSINFLVSILECCIEICFNYKLKNPSEAHNIWLLISSFYQVPLVLPDDYLEACVEKNLHLSFYMYVLHQIPQFQKTDNKIKGLSFLVDYIKRISLDEDCESKIILLWDKLFELCLSLSQENEVDTVCNFLFSFCQTLSILGKNRTDKGILAYIGLGWASPLSVRFRFLCRAMAAFVLAQMSKRGFLRLYPMSPGFIVSEKANISEHNTGKRSSPPTEAVEALEMLNELHNDYSFSMLRDQIELVIKSVMNPKMCFLDSRQLLKSLALHLYPDVSYLCSLDK